MRETATILDELRDGNARYARARNVASPDTGYRSVPEHKPRAVVVGCSDARVPVEQVFDQAPGSLFVVRVAGHVLEPAALASILFAVRELGVRVVIVLGHQACGAVRAAVHAGRDDALGPLVDPISARLRRNPGKLLTDDEAVAENARAAMAEVGEFLHRSIPDIAPAVSVHCAVKALDTGEVTWLNGEGQE